MKKLRLRQYVSFILGPFWRDWFATITGVAALLGFMLVPEIGISLSKTGTACLIMLVFGSVFLAYSCLIRCWRLFQGQTRHVPIFSFHAPQPHDNRWVFMLGSDFPGSKGMILDVRRSMNGTEAPVGIICITEETADGCFQAHALFVAPVQANAMTQGECRAVDLVAYPWIDYDRVRNNVEYFKEPL